MSERPSYFKIGLFVIVGTVLGVSALAMLGAGALLRRKVLFETYVDESVQGLDVGAAVKFRGVKVGTVESIGFVSTRYKTERRYVVVDVALYPEMLGFAYFANLAERLMREVESGLRVRLASQGLTGAMYLEVDYVDPRRLRPLPIDWEPQSYFLPSAESTARRLTDSTEEVIRELAEADVQTVAQKLDTLLGEITILLRQELTPTLANLNKASGALPGAVDELKHVMSERFMPRVEELTTVLRRATEEDLRGTLTAIQDVARSVSATLVSADGVLRRFDGVVASQEGNVVETMDSLRRAAERLEVLGEEAQKYPARLLFGGLPPRVAPGGKEP